ncbi:hypothetical protein RND81_05G214300 [Saponaria officinalis]|uniref:Uncharacterized protein n=1 Tax=Saponaria officinalis TaxID=3572 RepID=A0AAW1KYE8_SAPOF
MGCFLGCFGGSKDDKKRPKIAHLPHHYPNIGKQYSPVNQSVAAKQVLLEEPINSSISEIGVKPVEEKSSLTNNSGDKEEEQSGIGARKRVTFDSNVKEYEHVSCNEASETTEEDEKEADFTKPGKSSCTSESGSTLSSLGSFPPNHRYQNCRDSDDDDDELGCEVSDLDDDDEFNEDDDEEAYDAEYSDDEYYSRQVAGISTRSCSSTESGTKSSLTYAADDESQKCHESRDKETNAPPGLHHGARDRAAYVNSVLNPVENTAQWKQLKAKRTSTLKQQKENFLKSESTLNGPENNYSVAVDASLSTWLSPTKATPIVSETIPSSASMSSHGSNSVILREEKPILCALTMEELNQISVSSSPRKSPIQSSNEKPLVGTVGIHRTRVQDSVSASSFKGIPSTNRNYGDKSMK